MRIGLIGVGPIGVSHASTLRGLPGVDSLEAFYVAEACELSRHRQRPVPVAEVRR
jgi:myo-inositol 2-dehydrogenase / D-chiro-inositol 1-dehydrogenase